MPVQPTGISQVSRRRLMCGQTLKSRSMTSDIQLLLEQNVNSLSKLELKQVFLMLLLCSTSCRRESLNASLFHLISLMPRPFFQGSYSLFHVCEWILNLDSAPIVKPQITQINKPQECLLITGLKHIN